MNKDLKKIYKELSGSDLVWNLSHFPPELSGTRAADRLFRVPFENRAEKYGYWTSTGRAHWTQTWQDIFCLMTEVLRDARS
jgi:hypothetical protein